MSPEQATPARAVQRAPRAGRFLPGAGAGLLLAVLAACGSGGKDGRVASAAPTFTTQPADLTVVAGITGTFTSAASGSPVYQWARDGVAIAGAVSPAFTTPATTAADNNAVYSVTASNGGGSAQSGYATLHVNYATITTQPADTAVPFGQPATFTVAAAATGQVTYQWSKDGAVLNGATGATYTLQAPALADMGNYLCTVTSTLNGTTATAASVAGKLVVVTAAPTVTTGPADVTVLNGASATFSVAATNGATYQWFKNGLPLAGATAATYVTPSTVAGDDGSLYTVTVANPAGSVTSAPATLHVDFVRVLTQPASAILPEGGALNLAPVIAASGSVAYQWTLNGTALPGATKATYAVPSISLADAGTYVCGYVATLNGVTSQTATLPATLQVVAKPVLTTQPTGGTFVLGSSANLVVAATQAGVGNLTYQWKNSAGKVLALTPNYFIASLAATDSDTYTCTVTNTYKGIAASVTTAPVQLAVNGWPVITAQPSSLTVFAGRPATFAVGASGPGTLTYAWYRNGALIPGATSASYNLPAVALSDTGSTFHCVVANGNLPNATSADATLTVMPVAQGAPTFKATRTKLTAGQGVVFTYLFDAGATATFGPQGGPAAPVSSGGATTVYPMATTTYTLTVTEGGVATPVSIPVTVNTYTPSWLYVVNQVDANIYQYPVNANAPEAKSVGVLCADNGSDGMANALVGNPVNVHRSTGVNPGHITSTYDERFVYVANNGDATLSGFTVDAASGNLVPMTGSPFALPAGYTRPGCSAIDPSSQRLYVTCAEGIAVLTLDSASGALTAAPALCYSIPGHGQGDLVIHPSGQFLYVADSGSSTILPFLVSATGALSPNGTPLPVTFSSGYNPSQSRNIANPSNLTFDRAANLLFTRTDDPLGDQHAAPYVETNAAIDSYQVDPYTGMLTRLASSSSTLSTSIQAYLVEGMWDAPHALLFSATPGVDHLIDGYTDPAEGWGGAYLSLWTVDMDPASPTYGTIPGYWNDPNFGPFPHGIGGSVLWSSVQGASGLVQDRSGRILVPLWGNQDTQDLGAFEVNATSGSVSFMGDGTGETPRHTGNGPVHGLILGSLD